MFRNLIVCISYGGVGISRVSDVTSVTLDIVTVFLGDITPLHYINTLNVMLENDRMIVST